ncbi:hypothetical protein Bealeia1_00051 [Candidatus Bealeia paramacronuclearis]|uniref:Uncharacterized protein n=1 Tax=Candidatus Bealeia paramacronuclearis TaxID=1921001 RepID=A0ABZ2C259_9PROT|nr:hypothetical protein [Candidatus Bealeia paramacronuclearis]
MPFLKSQKLDVVRLQEVLFKDISQIENELNMKSSSVAMKILNDREEKTPFGLATFSPSVVHVESAYYTGHKKKSNLQTY